MMSAVDWWKSHEKETLAGFPRGGVRWIFSRSFGKLQIFPTANLLGKILQQFIRTIPTRYPHVLHISFTYKFAASNLQRNKAQVEFPQNQHAKKPAGEPRVFELDKAMKRSY
jgi:hypothetical protein